MCYIYKQKKLFFKTNVLSYTVLFEELFTFIFSIYSKITEAGIVLLLKFHVYDPI